MALVESVQGEADFEKSRDALFEGATEGATPWTFEIRQEDEETIYELGYVAERWVFELYAWSFSPAVPEEQSRAILGLLLGYNPSAIEGHLHRRSGKGKRAQWESAQEGTNRGYHGVYEL